METKEKSTTTAEEKEKEKVKKKPIKIRCSLFFDGTCNNRYNTDARTGKLDAQNESHTDKYEANKAHKAASEKKDKKPLSGKGDDSYENDYTNIATLEPNVWPKKIDHGFHVFKVYTDGPGTVKYSPDDTRGYGMGSGEASGVKTKVLTGIVEAVSQIQNKTELNSDEVYIKELVLDVFGFSRGAAAARYCINQLLEGDVPIQKRIENLGFEVQKVTVCFAGLFDTVASYNFAQQVAVVSTENWILKLKAVQHAEAVLHLAAAEEYRKNFCLHNIKSAGKKGKEYFLPGVHSDVGGSYVDGDSDAGLIVCRGSPSSVNADRNHLIDEGWYVAADLEESVLSRNIETDEVILVDLTVKGRAVSNAYCNIPLKIMADHATKNKITIESKLEEQATTKINAYPELQALEGAILSYIGKVGSGSKPSDWKGSNPKPLGVSIQSFTDIRYKHLHMSSKYNDPVAGGLIFPLAPRFGWFSSQRKRYEFNG